MNEKGSLINRIKDWFKIQKKKKLKKQRELNQLKKKRKQLSEEQKKLILRQTNIKKYSKFQVMNRISLGLFLGFFGSIINPKKREIIVVTTKELMIQQEKIKALDKEIRELKENVHQLEVSQIKPKIEFKIDQLKQLMVEHHKMVFEKNSQAEIMHVQNGELIRKLEKETDQIQKEVDNKIEIEKSKETKQLVDENIIKKNFIIESDQQEKTIEEEPIIDQTNISQTNGIKKEIPEELKTPTIKEILKSIVLTPLVLTPKKDNERNNTLTELREKKHHKTIDKERKKEAEIYLKATNKKIANLKNDFNDYKEWSKKSDASIEKKEYALRILEERMMDLINEYESLSKEGFFLDLKYDKELQEIDKNKILNNQKQLLLFVTECEQEISKLKIKKEMEERKEKKVVKIKKGFTELDDINLLNQSINENLEEQEKEIDKMKQLFKKADKMRKRGSLLRGVHRFLGTTITLAISILPLKLFKNKMVGIMGTGIVLNNRIRSMRKLINKQNNDINYITYKDVAHQINEQKACALSTEMILTDTLQQLNYLKTEFFFEFSFDLELYPEAKMIQKQFQAIEEEILRRNVELQDMLEEMNRIDKKHQKVLKLDRAA